jgi:hypothetical protein
MSIQTNRGKESNDDNLFGSEKMRVALKNAVEDLCHLMSRGYSAKSALALVGNRYELNVRQQKAVQGMSASEYQIIIRTSRSLPASELQNKEVVIDGFNALILLESLLSGAYVFKGADGFYRDLSSVHGSYKKVNQTARAIELIATFYVEEKIANIRWYFDKPVSNSGKLKQLITGIAADNNYNWEVFLTNNPDKDLVVENKIAITSDAWILDNTDNNFNLIGYIAEKYSEGNILALFDK